MSSPVPIDQIQNNLRQNNGSISTSLFEEIEIPVPWGHIAGKWWGPRNKQPVLALHGWQDNAGTFDRLCPLLLESNPELAILCVDLPGHGKSSHYPPGMQYYIFWDGISLIRRIVKLHDWQNVILLGHSLGGALTFMYAACFPDDVKKLINIDIAGPTVRSQQKIVASSGFAIDKFLSYEKLTESDLPCYSYNDMIELVVDAYEGSIDRPSAEILMKRGMTKVPERLKKDGYNFMRDLRLKVSYLGMFCEEQVLAYAEKITCEVLNIRAKDATERSAIYDDVIEVHRRKSKSLTYKEVSGTHHLHLVTPENIYKIIDEFLNKY